MKYWLGIYHMVFKIPTGVLGGRGIGLKYESIDCILTV
jgi:hypothetical protein